MTAEKTERGVCYLCGKECSGTPAKKDAAISMARRMRGLLRLPEKHTVACAACLAECKRKGAAFEKRLSGYRLGAALFFLLVCAGSAFFGRLDAPAVLGGILGGLLIWLLAYASYFPSFENPA